MPHKSVSTFETIILFAAVLIEIYILYWLFRLETTGCLCAMDWRRSFIIFYAFFNLLMIVLTISNSDLVVNLSLASMVFAILNIVFTIQYVHRLKKEKCECSESTAREVIYIAAFLQAGLILFGILYSAFIASKVSSVLKKQTKKR